MTGLTYIVGYFILTGIIGGALVSPWINRKEKEVTGVGPSIGTAYRCDST